MTRAGTSLDRVVERRELDGHDGRSGASLERVVLDDGSRLVVKRTSPAVDLVMRITGRRVSREYLLWRAGVLDDCRSAWVMRWSTPGRTGTRPCW